MWLMNHPPTRILQERYGFTLPDGWMEHLQKASVRFNNGGSGSFVSAEGLVMTNHHVGVDCLAKLSSEGSDYVKNGFHALKREDELKAPDLELNVLMSIEDVTDKIKGAVTKDMNDEAAEKARRAVMNTLESESQEQTGLRSDVVTLYRGGQYHLYRYKKYTDVRLVFAPELDIAFFGGDPDNFEFPRWCLDVTFFRVYEDDKPAHIEHFLTWSMQGSAEEELIFVTGHPGSTERLNSLQHLHFLRDKVYPLSLNVLRRREVLLQTYGSRTLENARRGRDDLFGVQNSRKSRLGGLQGLQDPAFMHDKAEQERTLRSRVGALPELQEKYGSAWDDVNDVLQTYARIYDEFYLLEGGQGYNSELFDIAHTLVRLANETALPNTERLREFRESNLDSLKLQLFSTAPIYRDLEIAKLSDSLAMMMEMLGTDHPQVVAALAGQSPRRRAEALVHATKLGDVEVRKTLAALSAEELRGCDDPMIQAALAMDPRARELRKTHDETIAEPLKQAYARIAQAVFDTAGEDTYPDATFTLRLAFGRVKSVDGIPAFTEFDGVFQHAEEHGMITPYLPPQRWLDKRSAINPHTPFNFISTADIVGGNSGSPVVNIKGEVVGLIFDGNIESLTLSFMYTDTVARAVSVDVRAILESLKTIYQADNVVSELMASVRTPH